MRKRLLVPKAVSVGSVVERDGRIVFFRRAHLGTKAFVESGGLFHRAKKGWSPHAKVAFLKKAAFNSHFFIKPVSNRARRIMALLEKNGVAVERPIQDLKDGTMLFEKKSNSIDSGDGYKVFSNNRKVILGNIGKIMFKMHSLGINHNHFHAGNISLTEKGEIVLLDFGKATISGEKRLAKGLNAEGSVMDLIQASLGIASVEQHVLGLGEEAMMKRAKEINHIFLDQYPPEFVKKIKTANEQIQIRLKK
jgi:tRNA A-37 threonylcarbamoyl transferase component Bud32